MPAAHAFSLQASGRARLFLSRCAQQRRSFKLMRDSAKRQVLVRTALRFLPWQPAAGAANRHAQNHWVFCRAHSLSTGQGLGDAQCGPERAANCGCRAVFVTSGGLRLCAKYRLHPFVVELCRVWLGLSLTQHSNSNLVRFLYPYPSDGEPLWLITSEMRWQAATRVTRKLLQTRAVWIAKQWLCCGSHATAQRWNNQPAIF